MKQCKQINYLLSDYLEGTLTARKKREIDSHLKVCPRCRQLVQSTQRVQDILPGLSRRPPDHLIRRLMLIPRNTEISGVYQPGIYRIKWIAAVFVTFLLLFNLLYFTNFNPRMNSFLHHLVFSIQKLKVKTESIYSTFKRKKTFDEQDNLYLALNSRQEVPKEGNHEKK
jgi:hypothetical protein